MNLEREIFIRALDLDAPDQQEALVAEACGDDHELRARILQLLSEHSRASGVLDSPLAALCPRPVERLGPDDAAGTTIGRYHLVEKLGEGGFGVVFLAEQWEPVRREVALKIIKPGMDTRRVIARFEAERQALALMNHPHIAKVLDGGTTPQGRPYFVMELVRGRPITRHCDDVRAPMRARLELFLQVCAAIHHAHQRGILHRDIKPGNVLVAQTEEAAVPKVIDFGIAKAVQPAADDDTELTRPHELLGTPAYMSPEQRAYRGLDVDTRTDVYSLGVLLYELLTGHTPHPSPAPSPGGFDAHDRSLQDPPKPSVRLTALPLAEQDAIAINRGTAPRPLSRALRGDLDRIVLKALEQDRSQRYESVREFADDVRRHLDNEPITAAPPTLVYRLRKFARRHRTALPAAALVTLALLTGTAVSLWQAREARREAHRARAEAATAAAVTRFLNDDLFSMADPTAQPDREVTVRALLDRASRQLPAGLADQPLVLAAIHGTLGRTYGRLSDHEQAAHHLDRAYALYLRELGERDERTIEALLAVASNPDPNRTLDEVIALTEKARDLALAEFGERHPLTVRCLMSLSWRYYTAQRRPEAHQAATTAWQAAQHVFATPEADAWSALHMLARARSAAGDVAGGESLLRRGVAVNEATHGPRHQWTIRAREGLAAYLYDRGLHLEEAESMYRESLQARLTIYGEDHDAPQHVRRNLALLLEATNRYPEAWQELIIIAAARPAIRETHSDMDRLRAHHPLPSLSGWTTTDHLPWRFLSRAPGEAWTQSDYTDESWASSVPAGARELWIRAPITLRAPLPAGARLLLRWQGAGRCEMMVNGQLATREPRRPRDGERYCIATTEAASWLQPGVNVITLRIREIPADATLARQLGLELLVFAPPE